MCLFRTPKIEASTKVPDAPKPSRNNPTAVFAREQALRSNARAESIKTSPLGSLDFGRNTRRATLLGATA